MEGSAAPAAPATARVACIVEYDGAGFFGLQRQPQEPTIQSEFERVARILGAGDCRFRASGRTDAGVHARGQVIALDMPAHVAAKHPLAALNWHLPESIRVRRVAACPEGFDPRRDAIRRRYRYLLSAGQVFPAHGRGRMGRVRHRLDIGLMRAAADALRGEHDFRAWRSTMCQARRTVLRIEELEVLPWRDPAPHGADAQCFEVHVACRSFLHRMVRFLVGGIVRAGSGALAVEDLRRHLAEKTLPPRVAPADACGLSLEVVEYLPDKDPFRADDQGAPPR